MEKGVLKYGEYDGEQSEPIRVDRDRESQTRVKKHAEKAEKIRVSTETRNNSGTADLGGKPTRGKFTRRRGAPPCTGAGAKVARDER